MSIHLQRTRWRGRAKNYKARSVLNLRNVKSFLFRHIRYFLVGWVLTPYNESDLLNWLIPLFVLHHSRECVYFRNSTYAVKGGVSCSCFIIQINTSWCAHPYTSCSSSCDWSRFFGPRWHCVERSHETGHTSKIHLSEHKYTKTPQNHSVVRS